MSELGAAGSGIGEAADARWLKLRQQLREAMIEKGYTYEDIAYMARVSLRAVHSLFSGEQMSRIDTVMRVALVVGARIELDLSGKKSDEEVGEFPLPVIEPRRSTGSRTSSRRSGAAANIEAVRATKKRKTTTDQQKRRTRKDDETHRYNEDVVYLRNYRRVSGQ